MKWIGLGTLWVLQIAALMVVYQGIATTLAIVIPKMFPVYMMYYGVYNALGDTQAILIVLFMWDRFFGPTSYVLRGVAKTLAKAKKAQKDRWDYAEE